MMHGKSLEDIPLDKIYVGMPVVYEAQTNPKIKKKGSVVYTGSSKDVSKYIVIKYKTERLETFVNAWKDKYNSVFELQFWFYDMSREGQNE